MSDCKKCMRCMKGVFPSGDELLKIVFLSILCTIVIGLVCIIISGSVSSFYRSYKQTSSIEFQALEHADKIIEGMNTMRATLRAFMAWYTDSLEDIRLGVKLLNGKTGEVIGEFTARPSGPVEAHPYTVNRDRDDRFTNTINIARDIKHAFGGDYILTVMDDGKALYVGYKLGDNEESKFIKRRLTVRSRTDGLLGKDGKTHYNKDDEVYMLVDGPNNVNAARNRNRK